MKHFAALVLVSCAAQPLPPSEPPAVEPPPAATAAPVATVTAPVATVATPEPPPPPPEPEPPKWFWPMDATYGMRVDEGGAGWFGARRGPTRTHSGIDLRADIGTPVRAVCEGQFKTVSKAPYGLYVQLVCPVPLGDTPTFISALYGHLSQFERKSAEFTDVAAGEIVGYVGKSGNAKGASILAHLHLEILVFDTVEAARGEQHLLRGKAPKGLQAPAALEAALVQCSDMEGGRGFLLGNKVDPFLLLNCLADRPKDEPVTGRPGKMFWDYYASVEEFIGQGRGRP